MKNLISVNSNTYHGFSLDNAIKGIQEAGFRYIELASTPGYTEHVRWDMSDSELDEVKAKLKAANLECIALGAHSNLMQPEGLYYFQQSIELARRLGCRTIITATGDAHDDHDVIEDENKLIRILTPLVKQCEANGLTLTIETHGNNYATGAAVKSLVEKFDSSHIGINYDTANVIFYGDVMPYEDLEYSSGCVKFMHLKDKAGANQEWNFPAIGHGYLDLNRLLAIMRDSGCDAPISVEIEFTSKGPSSLEEVNEAVAKSYSAIMQYIAKSCCR
jgi:L-ribulose-5-phosphate 3-epimerase